MTLHCSLIIGEDSRPSGSRCWKTVETKIDHSAASSMPQIPKTPHLSLRDFTVCHFLYFYFREITHSWREQVLVFISGMFWRDRLHNVLSGPSTDNLTVLAGNSFDGVDWTILDCTNPCLVFHQSTYRLRFVHYRGVPQILQPSRQTLLHAIQE